jgi:hypothetical protein
MKSLDWHISEFKRHFSGIETQTGDHNRPEKSSLLEGDSSDRRCSVSLLAKFGSFIRNIFFERDDEGQ